jgi:four helix bundle protein
LCFGARVEVDVNMPPCIICDRAFEFAARIVKLCDAMASRGFSARHIASQLIRCGTSIGANAEEAQEGQTKPDFIAKMSVSRKEAREAIWWLRVVVRTGIATADEVGWELSEAKQLLAMTKAAVKTARGSPNRGLAILVLALCPLLYALS